MQRITVKRGLSVSIVAGVMVLILAACNTAEESPNVENVPSPTAESITHTQEEQDFILANRDANVPDLPFDDNPDPTQCGIPAQWGDTNNEAYLSGLYEGEMFHDPVLLYDSHSRLKIVAEAPHGTAIEIVLYQSNPVTDYYMVRLPDGSTGWVPAPFLSFEPVSEV